MTGEMNAINQDGLDSNGESWPVHAAVAKAVGGVLKPFDSYQGPYISIGPDLRTGTAPYQTPVRMNGMVRLWIQVDEDGVTGYVYREDTDSRSDYAPYWDEEDAINAALSLLQE